MKEAPVGALEGEGWQEEGGVEELTFGVGPEVVGKEALFGSWRDIEGVEGKWGALGGGGRWYDVDLGRDEGERGGWG